MLRRASWFVAVCVIVLHGRLPSFGQQLPARQFPVGTLRRVQDLPPGRLRTQIERLPIPARDRAVAWLAGFHFTDLDLNSLHVDPSGGIYYVDHFELPPAGVALAEEPAVAEADLPVNPFPPNLIFHSKTGAPNVLFLNFSGENVSNTDWNSTLGRATIPAVGFSKDADYATFSDAEQLAIKRIWQRVAEDFAPFNIDVTTERPASFGPRTAHALITRSTDADGLANPSSGGGGVAYIGVFGGAAYATYSPAWIYFNNLSGEESYIAEAVSHEVGHNLGLSHDGASGTEYYRGHGSGDTSWAPIMGAGYGRNVSQWSKGEYYLANNTQDDIATIAGKLSYLADDHGNTLSSSTALRITDGIIVLATNPEDDPTRTNSANKGILERNTDVDVFSFATGNGPIDLTINPWIMPSGQTRGGNLDVSVELRNANGVVLVTNNSASATAARIQADLVEGVYYLYVRNSGADDPLSSVPTGYTPYASMGQYFITGSVVFSSFVIPPGADLQVTDIAQPETGAKTFTVTYSDNVAIDVSTIDDNDVLVTGPNGYSRMGHLVSIDTVSDGTPRVATYSVDPPAGPVWLPSDNGTYTVWLRTNEVSDVESASAAPGELGRFNVNVPQTIYVANMNANPGWALEPLWQYGKPMYSGNGPIGGFTGTNIVAYNLSGNYENRLPLVYATTPPINCSGSSTLTLRFRRWLRLRNGDTALIQVSTNGTAWTDVWNTTHTVADNSWQEVQYPLPAWTAGSAALRLRWGLASGPSQNDIGWNIDDVEVLGGGSVDTTPPVAALSAANITSAGSPTHSFTVIYTDNSAVKVSTLGSSDLLVLGQNGYSNTVEFIGVDTSSDGTPRIATYSVAAPGGTWDAADNGSYQMFLQNGEVTDTFNNATDETLLGTFTVAISTNQQALIVGSTSPIVPEGSNVVFTVRLAEQPAADVIVTVVPVGGDSNIVIESGTTNVFTSANWSTPMPVVLAASPDPDQENGIATFECRSDGLAPVTVIATELDTTPDVVLSVSLNNTAWGNVTPAGGSYPVGSIVHLTATPLTYFRFMEWTGGYLTTNNPLSIVLATNVALEAVFGEIVTAGHSVPYWWFAFHGYTENFEAAEELIGANGLPLWQSYIAGLDPTDPASQLRLSIEFGASTSEHVLRWNTVAGRVYTLLQSTDTSGGFAPMSGASSLPSTVQSFTNRAERIVFYRLEVRRP